MFSVPVLRFRERNNVFEINKTARAKYNAVVMS